MMLSKLKLLCLVPFILLIMEISPADGLRANKKREPQRPTIIPPVVNTASIIPRKKCLKVVTDIPNKHYIKGPLCVQLNERQKLDRLKEVGGFNPRYVAVNWKEAQKFVDLVGDVKPMPKPPPSGNFSQSSIQSNLLTLLQQHQNRSKSGGHKEGEKRSGHGTTTIQQCYDAGSLLEGGQFKRLCTECHAITQLAPGVFPRFINEVICGDSDFCVPNIGVCQQKVLVFKFIRFTGNFELDVDLSDFFGYDIYLEETETVEEDVRACCECRLFSFIGK